MTFHSSSSLPFPPISTSSFNYDARVELLAAQVLAHYPTFEEQVEAMLDGMELLDEELRVWEAERRRELVHVVREEREARGRNAELGVAEGGAGEVRDEGLSTVEEEEGSASDGESLLDEVPPWQGHVRTSTSVDGSVSTPVPDEGSWIRRAGYDEESQSVKLQPAGVQKERRVFSLRRRAISNSWGEGL